MVTPPIHLSMEKDDEVEEQPPIDEEEAAFLNFGKDPDEPDQNAEELFKDEDYEETNKTINRVKAFTFIKDQRP